MGRYAIVCDRARSKWWIQGDEGRVNEWMLGSAIEAHRYAAGMAEVGQDIDPSVYFVNDETDGPDWDNPVAISI